MGTGDSGPRPVVGLTLFCSARSSVRLEMMTVRERAPSLSSGAICCMNDFCSTLTEDGGKSSKLPLNRLITVPCVWLNRPEFRPSEPVVSAPFSGLLGETLSCSKRLRTAAKLPALGFKSVNGCGCESSEIDVISKVIVRVPLIPISPSVSSVISV